jgi:PPOX class probable F420-dependent enzyme
MGSAGGHDPSALPLIDPSERYVLLTTFRRDGRGVPTPVWFAPLPDDPATVAVITGRDAGKVKRLRHTPRCTLAPCDVRGRPHGDAVEASGRVAEDPSEIALGTRALARRYGSQWWLLGLGARLRGRDPAKGRSLLLIRGAAAGPERTVSLD